MGYTQGRGFMWKYSGQEPWVPEFDQPMGAPLGNATLDAAGVYTRRFTHGMVTFDTHSNKGHFEWAA